MCIVGNVIGTRCRDGVKMLWCHFHLFGWFFRVPSLHALVFIQKMFLRLFPALSCCLGMVRGKRGGGEVKGKMHGL